MAEALVAFDEKPEKSERKRKNREHEGVTKVDYKSVSPGNSPRSSQPDSDDQEQQDLRDELCRLLPHASRLPKRVKCHQCSQVMRLIYRSSDHTSVASISFRCPSRGCQTFKSPRQILRKMFPGLSFPRKDKLIESGSGKIDRLLQVSRKRASSEAPTSANRSRNRKTVRHRSEELKEDYGRKEELKADYGRKRQQFKEDCCENRRSEKLKDDYSRKHRNEELKKEDNCRKEKRRKTDLDNDLPSSTSRTPKKTVESKVHGTRRNSSSGKDSDLPFVITGIPKKTVESKVHGTRSHSSGGKSISATTKAWIELLKHNSDFEAESDDDDLNNSSFGKHVKPFRETPKVRHSGKGSKRIYSVEQEGRTPRRRSNGKQIPTYRTRTPSHLDSESSMLTSESDSNNEDVKPHRVAPQPQVRHSGKGSKGIYGMNVKQELSAPRRLPNGKQIPTYRTPCLPDRDGSRISSSVPRSVSTDASLPLFADEKVPYLLDDVNANYVNTAQPSVGVVDIGMEEVLSEYICSDSLDLDEAAMADDKIGDLENLQDIFPNISDDGSLDKYLMVGNERVPFNLIFSMLDDQDGGSYQDDVNPPPSTTVMSGEEGERRSSKV